MARINPMVSGASLAATVGIGYSACSVMFWVWPDAAASFMSALFHGLDFRKLQSGPVLFNFGPFLWALVVMVMWAFGLGAIFGWVFERFAHD